MTDKERDRIESAIRHLQTAVDVDPWAMEIAVEAMQEKISREPSEDAVSRKVEGRTAMTGICPYECNNKTEYGYCRTTGCTNPKYAQIIFWSHNATTEQRSFSCGQENGLVSRAAAIDAMEQAKKQYFDRRVIIGKMQDIVSNLPSAEPERKTGRWIQTRHFGRMYRMCSSCSAERKDDLSTGWNFCPNCGAKMEGEADAEKEV